MDSAWFKKKQKEKDVTSEQIAAIVGKARSNVSHIYAGRQKMNLEWAQAFAEALDEPIDEILRRSGAADTDRSFPIKESNLNAINRGFAEGDATPYSASPRETDTTNKIASLFGQKPGIDTWTVSSDAMRMSGYLPGDTILVDTHQSERTKTGDIVIAQIYDWNSGNAKTVLRRHEPPVLVSDGLSTEDQRVLVVDGNNVVIKGKVIALWRN